MTSELKPREKLKSCPFCGSDKIIDKWASWSQYTINCVNCGAETGSYIDPVEAESAWNRRASPAPLTDERLDELDTFSLHHLAPQGRESVREYGRAIEREILGKADHD